MEKMERPYFMGKIWKRIVCYLIVFVLILTQTSTTYADGGTTTDRYKVTIVVYLDGVEFTGYASSF